MILLKIGGGAAVNLKGIIADLSEVKEKAVIVHGANALRDELAKKTGYSKRVLTSVSGYSSVFSDEEALDLMMMAYAGLKNKRIVELCQQHGINAVGLSGLDGKMIQGQRNKGIRIKEDGKLKIVRDFSGKPCAINDQLLLLLLEHDYTPVLSVPIIDENQTAINSENDDIVAVLQQTLRAERIIQFIEAPGFLDDPSDPASLVPLIKKSDLLSKEERVGGRMKRKILALRKLMENTSCKVIMADGRSAHPLHDALQGKGTLIQ